MQHKDQSNEYDFKNFDDHKFQKHKKYENPVRLTDTSIKIRSFVIEIIGVWEKFLKNPICIVDIKLYEFYERVGLLSASGKRRKENPCFFR